MTGPGGVPTPDTGKPKIHLPGKGVKQAPKRLSTSELKSLAEKLITDIKDPEGLKALKQLIEGGHYKEAAAIIDKIITKRSEGEEKDIKELDRFFKEIFIDEDGHVKPDQLFQAIKHSKCPNDTKKFIYGGLRTFNKENTVDTLTRRFKYSSLFGKLGVEDKDGDGKIGKGEGYERIKAMDSDGDGKVTLEEITRHAVKQPKLTYSKELVESIVINLKDKIDEQKSLALLELMSKHDDYAKYHLAIHRLKQGQYRQGLKLLHECVQNDPNNEDAVMEYQDLMTYFGIKEDFSNIDDPNTNIDFLEDLAHYYKTLEPDRKTGFRGLHRSIYAEPGIDIDLYDVKNLQAIISNIINNRPNDPKLSRLKAKLEACVREFNAYKPNIGSGSIRMTVDGKPIGKTLTITNPEQTITITLPTRYAQEYPDVTFQRFGRKEYNAGEYVTQTPHWLQPVASGNPLMVQVKIPAWKLLKLFSPGEKDIKMRFTVINGSREIKKVIRIEIPTKVWGVKKPKTIKATDLYQRMVQDLHTHYQQDKTGPPVWSGMWVINAHKDHPELQGKSFTADRFYTARQHGATYYGLPKDGFKLAKTITERPTKKPAKLPKPTTALPDTAYTIKDDQIVQKWGHSITGEIVVISPREIRIYEKKVFPKDLKGELRAQFDKLPPEAQARLTKDGIIIRIEVPFYTDTYAGTTYHHQQIQEDGVHFNIMLTHLPRSQALIAQEMISSSTYTPRTKPGAVLPIHCYAGTNTPMYNAYGNLLSVKGPKWQMYGNCWPGIGLIHGIIEGRSNDGIAKQVMTYHAKEAKHVSPKRVFPTWDASEKATGGQYTDYDSDGLPDTLDPNPKTPNVYYYDKVTQTLRIFNPRTNKETTLKQFTLPDDDSFIAYPGLNVFAANSKIAKRSEPTFALYLIKKSQAIIAYAQQQPLDTQAASPK